MSIRWRLAVTALQLLVLASATMLATGQAYSGDTWFAAGLLAVVINPQLLEPFYSRPADVVGNAVISLLLFLTTDKAAAVPGWILLAVLLVVALALAILSIVLGAGQLRGTLVPLAQAAGVLSREATALRIYSVVFWLSLVEAFPQLDPRFWVLGVAWATIVLIGSVNWQRVWVTMTGLPANCVVEGMIGPSRLLVSGPVVPEPGSCVSLDAEATRVDGVVIARIRRSDDVWGQVHVADQRDCERLLQSRRVRLSVAEAPESAIVGSVDTDSTDTCLCFCPTRPLEIGSVVSVRDGESEVLYQLSSAKVREASVKGGAHLQVWARAAQLGRFDVDALRLRRHRWVPCPGAAVTVSSPEIEIDYSRLPAAWLHLGNVLGTAVPVFLDIDALAEGHAAILGMTRMGKTSLACRLAGCFARNKIVTVLDQTGEYANKRGLNPYGQGHDHNLPGLSVFEPRPGQDAAIEARNYLKRIMGLASTEYATGSPTPRVMLIDEAHQFVPEPAGLSFGATRNASLEFGNYMMQVRKYGITVLLVSQRTAVVGKSALSQCENLVAFRNVDKTGLDYLETVAGGDVRDILPRLQQGEALVFGPAISSDAPVAIKVLEDDGTGLAVVTAA